MAESSLIEIISELARDVFRTLGSGHSEIVYQKAMEVGLRLRQVRFDAQQVIALTYKDHYIGEEYLDLLVEAESVKVIVELKTANQKLGPPEEQQLRNYMQALGIQEGLLINFPQPSRTQKSGDPVVGPEIKVIR